MELKEFLFPFIVAYEVNNRLLQNHKFYRTSELNSKWRNLLEIKLGMYDGTIKKIEDGISGKTYDEINSQWKVALEKNNLKEQTINEILLEINKSTYEGILSKWKNLTSKFGKKENVIGKISNDLYTSHERGISNVERKAASLLVAVGFSISLISIIAGFTGSDDATYIELLALFFFGLAIINMVIAAVSAWFAERVHERSISTAGDLEKVLGSEEFELDWATKQLTHLELNNVLWTVKGNWLDVGQRHFIRGLIFTVVGFFVLVTEITVNVLK